MFCRFSSPSSQRAWIEIYLNLPVRELVESPSSQRAWIEIVTGSAPRRCAGVALLAEGVDRNPSELFLDQTKTSRPPRRGRG